MELFDGRHFPSALGRFDAVCQQDNAAVDGKEEGFENSQDQRNPSVGQFPEVDACTVEKIQKSVIAVLV